MKKGQGTITQTLRRAVALSLVISSFWIMSRTSGGTATASLADSFIHQSDILQSILDHELNIPSNNPFDQLSFLERMAFRLSPTFSNALTDWDVSADYPPQVIPDETPTTDDHYDPQTLPQSTHAPDNIISRDMSIGTRGAYLSAGSALIDNQPNLDIDPAVFSTMNLNFNLNQDGPQILIVHTHGSEAYTQDGTDIYTPTDPYRTTDSAQNILRVGEEVASVLTEMGLSVIQATALHDYPEYNGSYDRSAVTIQSYLDQYPTIQIILDIHRDALTDADGTLYKPVTTINGEDCAQVMMVMGSDMYYDHPNWKENLNFAVKVEQSMNLLWPNLARPIAMRTSRYNQQYSVGSLLVEVGSHGNTLQEALAGARMFARSLGVVLLSQL